MKIKERYQPTYKEVLEALGAVSEIEYNKLLKKTDKLEKRLEIATKALKEYDNKQNWDIRGVAFMKYNKGFTIARKTLKEMEGVK